MYRGVCDYVPKKSALTNASIASSSFHFVGYLVGYLIWGFLTMYLFVLFIGMIIIAMRMFIGDIIFSQLLLTLVPVLVVFLFTKLITFMCTSYFFLVPKTRILALNNTRAYNIFLFFNLFFDCFMGFLSAIGRIITSSIFAIFMMPRIGYGFMGRKLERLDPSNEKA